MKGALAKATELAAQITPSFIPSQFENAGNPKIHETTTAQELWRDTDGEIAALVCGVGSGGTATGVARAIKKKNTHFKLFTVEPAHSAVTASLDVASRDEFRDKLVVVVLPDTGERYLSTTLYAS